jgi:hypothetical protein
VVAAVHFVFSILFGCVSMLASMVVRFLEHIRFLTKTITSICIHSWKSFCSTNNIIALNFRLNYTLARSSDLLTRDTMARDTLARETLYIHPLVSKRKQEKMAKMLLWSKCHWPKCHQPNFLLNKLKFPFNKEAPKSLARF